MRKPRYRAWLDLLLVGLFGVGGTSLFLMCMAFAGYAVGIEEPWPPRIDLNDKWTLLALLFGATPAWLFQRFVLYRRWRWPPYSVTPSNAVTDQHKDNKE